MFYNNKQRSTFVKPSQSRRAFASSAFVGTRQVNVAKALATGAAVAYTAAALYKDEKLVHAEVCYHVNTYNVLLMRILTHVSNSKKIFYVITLHTNCVELNLTQKLPLFVWWPRTIMRNCFNRKHVE